MRLETTVQPVTCPYCGERFEVVLDLSVEQQDYIEDCYVCCRPIQFDVQVAGDEVWVSTRHENE
ncbi:MAG: CPXCG motif-containing cysteine-rich protein [Pseudomonadota bacterium]